MTFTYPAVITPHKDDDGFHIVFPDLELCEGDGPDLEDALDDAREAAYNWLMVELEEGGEFPAQSHEEDIEVPEGGFVRRPGPGCLRQPGLPKQLRLGIRMCQGTFFVTKTNDKEELDHEIHCKTAQCVRSLSVF